jgi:hypothetical protein
VGDELIIYRSSSKIQTEETIKARVRAMARFRVTLEGLDGEDLPWMYAEFDIRTRQAWDQKRTWPYKLHTPETLAYEARERQARAYLWKNRLRELEWSSSLRAAYTADPLGFVNTLRRFEGLDEI